jgi:hypothetical protein
MAKTWEEMTLVERVEDLRRDMMRTMEIARTEVRLAQLESQALSKGAAS